LIVQLQTYEGLATFLESRASALRLEQAKLQDQLKSTQLHMEDLVDMINIERLYWRVNQKAEYGAGNVGDKEHSLERKAEKHMSLVLKSLMQSLEVPWLADGGCSVSNKLERSTSCIIHSSDSESDIINKG
jgi:hypothetical protein